MFYDPDTFSFRAALEHAWRDVRDEYVAVSGELSEWVETELYDGSWKVYPLFEFPHGARIPAHADRCPFTASLVEEHFAGHGVAGFSVLGPQTTIRPHEGYQGSYLRCHLGLETPEGDCRIVSGGESRGWQAGQVLVFDDRLTHEAWNRTDQPRAILMVDFPERL